MRRQSRSEDHRGSRDHHSRVSTHVVASKNPCLVSGCLETLQGRMCIPLFARATAASRKGLGRISVAGMAAILRSIGDWRDPGGSRGARVRRRGTLIASVVRGGAVPTQRGAQWARSGRVALLAIGDTALRPARRDELRQHGGMPARRGPELGRLGEVPGRNHSVDRGAAQRREREDFPQAGSGVRVQWYERDGR